MEAIDRFRNAPWPVRYLAYLLAIGLAWWAMGPWLTLLVAFLALVVYAGVKATVMSQSPDDDADDDAKKDNAKPKNSESDDASELLERMLVIARDMAVDVFPTRSDAFRRRFADLYTKRELNWEPYAALVQTLTPKEARELLNWLQGEYDLLTKVAGQAATGRTKAPATDGTASPAPATPTIMDAPAPTRQTPENRTYEPWEDHPGTSAVHGDTPEHQRPAAPAHGGIRVDLTASGLPVRDASASRWSNPHAAKNDGIDTTFSAFGHRSAAQAPDAAAEDTPSPEGNANG